MVFFLVMRRLASANAVTGLGVALIATALVTCAAIVVGSFALHGYNSESVLRDENAIRNVLSCFSVGLSQKDISAYTEYMTSDAYVDFTATGAPLAGPVSEWMPFQEFVWEFFVQTMTAMFPTPCITLTTSTNASITVAFHNIQSSYTVDTPGDSRLPAIIAASTANIDMIRTSTGWKMTSLIVQPNGTLVGISPSISGVINPPVKRRSVRTLTEVELERKHYFEMLIERYQEMQRPDLIALLELNPEYQRLFH